ncbi:MAG TPA: hypothetical protein VK348_06895, partial [Planctomycetota bacterium]|nr:hypothetical protein [Planctomycetota bacterium]
MRIGAPILAAGLLAFTTAAQQPVATAVTVRNTAPVARTSTVLASVPFATGELPCAVGTTRRSVLRALVRDRQGEREVPAVPLAFWRDGSVCVLQAHVRLQIPALGTCTLEVKPRLDADGRAQPAAPAPHRPLLPASLPLWTELTDPWGRIGVARLEPDATAGPDGVLSDSGAVQVRRFRSRHRLVDGPAAGAPSLGLRAYLVTFDGERRGELTLLLDNCELSGGDLGPCRFRSYAVCTSDDHLRFLPAFAAEQRLPPPSPRQGGGFHQWLLAPDDGHYLGDQTAKAFRLHLFADAAAVDDDERAAARWAEQRLVAFPELQRVRATGAFGAHGGPAPIAVEERSAEGELLQAWRAGAWFGPYGGFGDPQDAAVQGHARNGDAALHTVLRWRSAELLHAAEGMLLQQPLRPTSGRAPALPIAGAPYRQGLGPIAVHAPHGFTAVDYEHFSALLLYDYYWLCGDPLALDELARLGRGLRAELAALPFKTSRGEGWCMQSGALIARATGDRALAEWLQQRFEQQIAGEL